MGSFPATTTDEAMRAMADSAGPLLHTLPTGETRRYEYYVRPILEDLVAQGALEVARAGEWRTRRDRPRYRLPPGRTPTGAGMDLGYAGEAAEALPIFSAVRADLGRPELALQIGMPTDLTLAFVALGPKGIRSGRAPFTEATAREIATIARMGGDDVVIQLEATAELVAMALTQPAHRMVERVLGSGRGIAALAAAAPQGTRIGVHLCLGSLHNKGAPLRTARPFVDLANSVARHWPSGRTLEYVHVPFAAGDRPPAAGPGSTRPSPICPCPRAPASTRASSTTYPPRTSSERRCTPSRMRSAAASTASPAHAVWAVVPAPSRTRSWRAP